jgi:bifunctional N-acetylglucosamine-1-phosphate-uridyltransferase/glucosamine-1-phosphate-acetyltransferase GlmU-like protein
VSRTLIVPAAGRGSRLGGERPKLLVEIAGRAMIDRGLDLHAPAVDRFVVVVAPGFRPEAERHLERRAERIAVAVQAAPTGMLDAILAAAPRVAADDSEEIWITWCDQVGIRRETTARLAALMRAARPDLALPTAELESPYIHFERDRDGQVVGVRQRREGAAMPAVGESDAGLFALSRRTFTTELPVYAAECVPSGGTRERNFLPFIPWLVARGGTVRSFAAEPIEALGVNTPEDLTVMAAELARRPSR